MSTEDSESNAQVADTSMALSPSRSSDCGAEDTSPSCAYEVEVNATNRTYHLVLPESSLNEAHSVLISDPLSCTPVYTTLG